MEHLNQAKTEATTKGYRNIFLAEPMEKKQFANELIEAGTAILRTTGKATETFTIDETNRHIVAFMYGWWNNVEHGFNRNAGILICGKIGAGKSILMRAFMSVLAKYTGKVIFDADCKNFNTQYIEIIDECKKFSQQRIKIGTDYFKFRPMYFDDLGRESKQVKIYGTEISPVPDVLFQRYDTGAYTFATSNFSFDELKKESMYGLAIADRLGNMFNVFEMKNNSRRN